MKHKISIKFNILFINLLNIMPFSLFTADYFLFIDSFSSDNFYNAKIIWLKIIEDKVAETPILGRIKIGIDKIKVPKFSPRYKYHRESPGAFFRVAVFGEIDIFRLTFTHLLHPMPG